MINEQPPQELIDWLDHIRTVGIAPSTGPSVKSYFIQGRKVDGSSKEFRCIDAADAEDMALRLWNTGRWTRLDINSELRYGA